MAFDYDQLMSYQVPVAEQRVTPENCLLYALSLGLGRDPLDPHRLRFVYERDLKVLPMMGNVLAYPGFWFKAPETGVDWHRLVHAEQALILHRPLPTDADLIGRTRVTGIQDKGPERGALVFAERRITEVATGAPVCTVEQTAFCRGDGGCGGDDPPPRKPHELPGRAPDHRHETAIPAGAALLYRLNGDMNPLHVDPEVAQTAGFERPILHGLCTFGLAGVAVLEAVCGWEPAAMTFMSARFTAPVFPGDRLTTEIWHDGATVSFRASVPDREAVVLDRGRIDLAAV